MEITRTEVYGFSASFRGMRNPMNSHHLTDSRKVNYCNITRLDVEHKFINEANKKCNIEGFLIGDNDLNLAQRLIKAGNEHCKFLRQIHVWCDINEPRYWWSEMDTYKHNNKNSTSTMHRLLNSKTEITKDLFTYCVEDIDYIENTVNKLNEIRDIWLNSKTQKEKDYCLLRAKRILPEGFNQLRTIDTNYAELRNIYFQRRKHRLKEEWCDTFCKWIEDSLPYSKELICLE